LNLVIVHYHLRPGGIRRVVELATPYILRASCGGMARVTLASGEPPDRKWREFFVQACDPVPVEIFLESAFGYFSEQRRSPAMLRQRIRHALNRLLNSATEDDTVVWAHNLGLARNLILTQELTAACEARGLPFLAHHHDWWFDNRWPRWQEARHQGFRSLDSVARAIFGSPRAQHLAINQADSALVSRHLRGRVSWLPNLAESSPPPPPARVNFARDWLRHRFDHDAPMWLLPCRLLRRKNVAEALLLTRWLRPEAWLVTTGGVSSVDEQAYLKKLDAAARGHHWRLRLGVLAGDETRKPSVAELLAASEAVLLTSIQEGFGLPYLEATATARPLIARALPNIAPDLRKFGFHFPQYYQEIQISTGLFGWEAERARQRRLFRTWLHTLPVAARKLAGEPHFLSEAARPEAVPFSRLTLTAQLQVLAQPLALSWQACVPLNPFLKTWRERAQVENLRVARWPRRASRWLSGGHYGMKFWVAHKSAVQRSKKVPMTARTCQEDFIRHKLHAEFLYPLLWSCES